VGRHPRQAQDRPKRPAGNADGLTRTQAEREFRRLVEATTVVAKG
jgi:hypothetical protein